MSCALTDREGRPGDSAPVVTFFDAVGFPLGFPLEEIELDIVIDAFFCLLQALLLPNDETSRRCWHFAPERWSQTKIPELLD